MTVFLATAKRAGLVMVPAIGLAVLFAMFGVDRDPRVPDAVFAWLHVPALCLTALAAFFAIDEWPLFARDRRDARWVARLGLGGWQGCVAASCGAITVLALGLAVTAIAFAWFHDTEGTRPVRAFGAVGERAFTLDADAEGVTVPTAHLGVVAVLELRVLVRRAPGATIRPTGLRLLANGEPLHERPLEFVSSADKHRITFEPRRIDRLELRRTTHEQPAPTITVPNGWLQYADAETRSRSANAVLASLTYALTAAIALAAVTALRGRVGSGTATFTALGLAVVVTTTGIVPNARAVDACVQGRWPWGDADLHVALLQALGICVVLLAAGLRRGRTA